MRILHTSDWHLGHTLHDLPRDHEHDRFLAWLLGTLEAERIDALIIAGDVFETANPPATAQARWYRFLAEARERMPRMGVVVIGGNHDSAARLDAPVPLLEHMRMHIVGGLPRRDERGIDMDRVIVPLRDARGEIAAYLAAVPFLRPADLPRDADGPSRDPLIDGVRQVHAEILDAARARCTGSQALLAAGHCYMVGTELSTLSERRVLGGNQHALPVDIFPDDVAYVALGHLHKAQRVGGREHVRYSGAPLPLAMNEASYRHQVLVVELDGAALAGVRTIEVPRAVELLRVPRTGAAPPGEITATLREQDDWDGAEHETRPYLEVCVRLSRPDAHVRQAVEQALEGKRPRLVKLSIEYTGDARALADVAQGMNLRDVEPHEVFLRRYHRDHDEEPPAELVAAFHELLDRVRQEGAS